MITGVEICMSAKTWCSVHVLGSTSVNLDFCPLCFDLQRVWTGQSVAFSCAWPTFHIHCNSMGFVNSLHRRVRSNTHKQPSGAFSPQRELDSQHYILHLKQDQLIHTLKNKGTVSRSCSFGECWHGPPSNNPEEPTTNKDNSYVSITLFLCAFWSWKKKVFMLTWGGIWFVRKRLNANNVSWRHILRINSTMRIKKVMWLCTMGWHNLTNQQTDQMHSIWNVMIILKCKVCRQSISV